MAYYRRRSPELWEEIAAVAAGAAAGLAAHWLARTLLRRDRLPDGDAGADTGERPSPSTDRRGGRAPTSASR